MIYGNQKTAKLGGYRFQLSKKMQKYTPIQKGPFVRVELPNAIVDCDIKDLITQITIDEVVTKAGEESFPTAFSKILAHNFVNATINGEKVVKGSLKTREILLPQPTKSIVLFMLNQIYMPGDLFYLYVAYPGNMAVSENGYSDAVIQFLNSPPEHQGEKLNEILNALRKDKDYQQSLLDYIRELKQYLATFFLNAIGMMGRKKANYLASQVNSAIDRYEGIHNKLSIFDYLLRNNYHAPRKQYVVRNPFKVVSNMILATRQVVPLFVQDSRLLPDPDYVRFNKKATAAYLFQLVNLGPTVMYYKPLY
jgi:hypothetical protein